MSGEIIWYFDGNDIIMEINFRRIERIIKVFCGRESDDESHDPSNHRNGDKKWKDDELYEDLKRSGPNPRTLSRIVPEIGIEWRAVSYQPSRVVPTSFTILLGWKRSRYTQQGGNKGRKSGKTEREKAEKENNLAFFLSLSVFLSFSCVFRSAVLKAVVTRSGNPHFLAPGQEVRSEHSTLDILTQ